MTFLGISYHMPGSFATERALLITEHMKAMGLLDSARVMYVLSIPRSNVARPWLSIQFMAYFHIFDTLASVDHCLNNLAFPSLYWNQYCAIHFLAYSLRTFARVLCNCGSSTLRKLSPSGCCCVHVPFDGVCYRGSRTEISINRGIGGDLYHLSPFLIYVLIDGIDWVWESWLGDRYTERGPG